VKAVQYKYLRMGIPYEGYYGQWWKKYIIAGLLTKTD